MFFKDKFVILTAVTNPTDPDIKIRMRLSDIKSYWRLPADPLKGMPEGTKIAYGASAVLISEYPAFLDKALGITTPDESFQPKVLPKTEDEKHAEAVTVVTEEAKQAAALSVVK